MGTGLSEFTEPVREKGGLGGRTEKNFVRASFPPEAGGPGHYLTPGNFQRGPSILGPKKARQ